MRNPFQPTTTALGLACVGALYGLVAVSAEPAEPGGAALDLSDETARVNYSVGYQIGGDFKRQGIEMDATAVVQGIGDALSDAEPKMTEEEMRQTLVELKQKVVAEQRKRSVERELEMLAAGEAFMEENARKEGVQTTESGLQYEILEAGTGERPGPQDQVTVHYRGKLINGTEFDSSHKRDAPATFRLDGVIKGWAEGLQLMQEGGKARFVIPPKLGYGDRGPLGHRTLIFDVELLAVEPAPAGTPEGTPGD